MHVYLCMPPPLANRPMLDEEIARFQDNIKPYWLTPARDKLALPNSSVPLSGQY